MSPLIIIEHSQSILSTLSGSNPTITYTPKNRIPRWHERTAFDSFTFSGLNGSGNTVKGVVNVCIKCATPTDRFLQADNGSTKVYDINANTLTTNLLTSTGGGNSIATNNVDGIVTSLSSATSLRYWDPVSNSIGTLSLTGIRNWGPDMDTTGGAVYNQNTAALYMLCDSGGTTENTMWYYRIGFTTYITGATPVVKTLDMVRLYTDNGLSVNFTSSLGDLGWDPISERCYVSTTAGKLYYFYPEQMRYNSSGQQAVQVFHQASDLLGDASGLQLTFNCDGSTLYSVKTSTDNVYTINRVPSTASLVGTATPATTGGAIDLAEWPCTQPV